MYIVKLDKIVTKYNITYYQTIKMEPINVKSSTYFDFGVENSDKNTKFKGHPVKISKYNFFFFLQNVIKKFG